MKRYRIVYRVSFAKGEGEEPEYHVVTFGPDETFADVARIGSEFAKQYEAQGYKVRAVHLRLHTGANDNWLRLGEADNETGN